MDSILVFHNDDNSLQIAQDYLRIEVGDGKYDSGARNTVYRIEVDTVRCTVKAYGVGEDCSAIVVKIALPFSCIKVLQAKMAMKMDFFKTNKTM